MDPKFLKPYDWKAVEETIYKRWEESGFFNPDNLPVAKSSKLKAESFCIIMPPPNANGSLHAGHAVFVTIEDLMTRYRRMRGYKTLWLPGADHAGFETQVVYEKKLEKEERSRFDMEPEALRKEILNFTLANKSVMESELRRLGASCDWSREKFTLDPAIVKIVYDTFLKLHKDGLAYRGKRTVNWCPKHQTSLSELETETVEEKSKLYYLKYGPFTIATARPETKFGDKYVVMHPDDARYKEWRQGQMLTVEWINGPITATIIKDPVIDMEFGTGVMTMTPWHSAVDFELAKKHNLDIEQIIDWRGKLLPIAQEFAGTKITEAREKIIEKLKDKGLLVKIDENYTHAVKRCYKCNSIIEPQVKDQWFVKMEPLAKAALKAINNDAVVFHPDHHKKIITHWLENIEDWNISRQIVWGIPIPAWYRKVESEKLKVKSGMEDGVEIHVGEEKPEGDGWVKDEDTFDTWFSSGQWPFATLGFPDGADFKTFYPTSVMETAGEIIFFWVARMIMLGLYRTGEVPFHTVYLHGLITARGGEKMSKSKGNVISPIELAERYGTDALRMGLVIGNTPGTTTALYEEKIRAYKLFANKIWNAARFVLSSTESAELSKEPKITVEDEAHLSEWKTTLAEVTKDIEEYRFYLAGEKLYQYFWHTFADRLIEESKTRFKGDGPDKTSCQCMLLTILAENLKALHPFMPFITEEIWSSLPESHGKLLMIESWPLDSARGKPI